MPNPVRKLKFTHKKKQAADNGTVIDFSRLRFVPLTWDLPKLLDEFLIFEGEYL